MLSDLRTEMNRLFDNFIREPFGAMTEAFGWQDQFAPSLDVTESAGEITVQAELPGVDPKDLDITVNADRITISGEKKETIEKKENSFHHKEIRSGKFTRTLPLPAGVDTENITAEHKNGVLTVKLKKSPESAARKISVQSG
jgi:HSP20 family protein